MPTITRVKTVYTPLSAAADNVASTAASVATNVPAHSAPEIPPHLAKQLRDMYSASLKGGGSHLDNLQVSTLLNYFTGAAVVGGLTYGAHKLHELKNNLPPGENARTWKKTVKYTCTFVKSAVRKKITLARDIVKAHEALERAGEREAKLSERLGHAEHTLNAILDQPVLGASERV
jgi:hypothetical protein